MCGIGGLVGEFVPGLGERMARVQGHRGPDGSGVFEDPEVPVTLSHCRLAIIDLTAAAAQPMSDPAGRYVLVYNGEVYNYRELRRELEADGARFRSASDTEVVLLGLAMRGPRFLSELNGIFALALWDHSTRELLLARDPFGVKPLYYAVPRAGTLVFASEIKALCAYAGLERSVDLEAIQQHLAFCHASGDRTALRGVRRLPPGHLGRFRTATGSLELAAFRGRRRELPASRDRREAARRLQVLIGQATERQLVSDVPVGTLLSGGLDSSLVTTFASRAAPGRLQCYTITYPGSDNVLDQFSEDAPFARGLARQLGVELHEIEIAPAVAELWPWLVAQMDEPVADPAAVASYLVCREAHSHGTTVLLSGQGGDELFCGYPRYLAMAASMRLGRLPFGAAAGAAWAGKRIPGALQGRLGAGLRRLRRGLSAAALPEDERFLAYCAHADGHEIERVLAPDVRAELNGRHFGDGCLEVMAGSGLEEFEKYRERDLEIYLPNHNLLYTDKTGMATGVEVRVPLLDLEVADEVRSYPTSWLIGRGVTKRILRDAARGVVPDAIIDRRKAGFGAPYRKWLRYDLAEMWSDLTSEDVVRRRGWFDHAALQDARRRSQTGHDDLYMLQWAVLTIELWARSFIDHNPAVQV